jgi:hypothetical protein
LAFEYSAAVGRYGTPVAGVVSLLLIIAATWWSLGGRPGIALAVLVLGFGGTAMLGRWLAQRGVLALPWLRRRGVNVEARRGHAEPRLWIVAHIDSKSQPIPLLARAAGIVLLAIAALMTIALAVGAVLGHRAEHAWPYVLFVAAAGALPVLGSVVGTSSHGAIDNASGVATVLTVAETISSSALVGVLITDAEELGLAGARAWCAETRHPRSLVLNCDGVDDGGPLTVMWTRPRAPRIEDKLSVAARSMQLVLRVIPLVPGVLVDGVAFSDAGWEAVTLSRGSLGTLRRIHTRGDDLAHLQGTGIADAVRLMTHAIHTLTES